MQQQRSVRGVANAHLAQQQGVRLGSDGCGSKPAASRDRGGALICAHCSLEQAIARAQAEAAVQQAWCGLQDRGNPRVDHRQRQAVLACQHIDGRASSEIVRDHLRRDFRWIGTDASQSNAMVGREYHDARLRETWLLSLQDQPDAHGQRFQLTERAARLGAGVQAPLQSLSSDHRPNGKGGVVHAGTVSRMIARRHLILGGARSGKTRVALEHAATLAHPLALGVTYVATARIQDAEMAQRIERHRAERPGSWSTVEAPLELAQSLHAISNEVIIVDCLTLWLSNALLQDFDAAQPCAELGSWSRERAALLEFLDGCTGALLLVSNEVGSGVVPMSTLARRFRDEQGWLNQAVARICERVTLVVAGIEMPLKGA
jgi:adenosylcobinamide kinase/adenosylcobinamide-phosphate guanylyltransferase